MSWIEDYTELEEMKAINKIYNNSKYFYSFAKSKSNAKTKIGPLMANGEKVEEDDKRAEIFKGQYESQFSTPKDVGNIDENFFNSTISEHQLDDLEFTQQDIEDAISQIKVNSQGGADTWSASLIKKSESDLRSFSERKEHFEIRKNATEMLFTLESRPFEIQKLYEDAAETPLHIIREIDRFRSDGFRSSMYFTCKPVFGDSLKKEKLRKLLDIETRRPASFVALRDWGSDDETLQSEVELAPVSPATPLRPPSAPHPSDLKLPLPEQRQLALSYKYPPQLVPIDVSGQGFRRMELFRQSLVQFDYVKNRKRRRRLRRRNTIADTREARAALGSGNPSDLPSTSSGQGRSSARSVSPSSRGGLSSYTDRSFDTSSSKTISDREVGLRTHVLGLDVSLPTPPRNVYTLSRNLTKGNNTFRIDSMNHNERNILNSLAHSSPREQRKFLLNNKDNVNCDDFHSISEDAHHPINTQSRDLQKNKQGVAKLPISSSSSAIPISSSSSAINMAVKLRESNSRDEGTRSSSGNWSGSSSTRTSLESDIQHQHNHIPKPHNNINNTTQEEEEEKEEEEIEKENSNNKEETSKDTANHVLDQHSPSSSLDQESFFSESYPETTSRTTEDLPSSSSHTSDGTLTPTQDIGDIPFVDDDTGSAFSCDAEGYYTSFHIDSGLRSVSYEGNKLATDSDIEVFGRGSTGTTNSSASLGTVIMRNPEKKTPPKPPQRVSSLERKENRESVITVIHVNGSASSSREDVAGAEGAEKDGRSSKETDSGRETAEPMSPKNSTFSPEPSEQLAAASDRKENLRTKTAINSSGIPSMCVITPPQSDDESIRSGNFQSPRDAPQGGYDNKPTSISESRIQHKVAAFQGNNSKASNFAAVRQPGDGAVAPSVPSSSPSFTSISSQQSYTPTLTVMSQHRSGELSAQLKMFTPSQESQSTPKTQPDYYSLGRSVSERRAEIQLKVLGEKKPSSDVLLQKQGSKESVQPVSIEPSNLVSLKELPSSISSSHPFSAIPSTVKQNVVITPTNSLERRKTNSKLGAHVTLDSEGKVVYSSDSLPRRKGHTSFEPGPYIKPPPITSAPSNGTQSKVRLSGVSSIQNMPLPPVPGQQSTQSYNVSSPGAALKATNKNIDSSTLPSSITPQQPKLGTRSQVSAISQTLSGLSSHMQPRTISQINSLRSSQVKSPKTVLQEPLKSVNDDEPPKYDDFKGDGSAEPSQQQYYQTKHQSHMQEKMEQKIQENIPTGITSILKKSSSTSKEDGLKYEGLQIQEIDLLNSQKLSLQQASQSQFQTQQAQDQMQSLSQQSAHYTQHKLQQHQSEQHQMMMQLQQQQKQYILQQQHIELQKQLEQQQQELQQHKARQAELQSKKEMQMASSHMENIYQTRQELQRQQLAQLQQQQQQQQLAAYQQSIYQPQDDLFMIKQQQLLQSQQQQQLLQQQQQRSQNGSQACSSTEIIMASQGAPMSPQSQRGAYIHIQPKMGQATQDQVDSLSYAGRSQNSQGYHVSNTSRAPTPIQGLSSASSPQRLPATNHPTTLQHQGLRTHPGMLYGSQRSLQNLSLGTEGRATPIPRPMSTSPPPYEHYNVTNSDIYGRIGMTRQVQVGGTLPAGFGRNQRTYSSLPPNLRQPLPTTDLIVQQQHSRLRQHHSGSKTLTRRASVAGTETSNVKMAASNPSTPEKALDKKEKGSRREKDKDRDKDKDKKKKEAKTEKSPKKKWFWTLPLRRKKKSKDDQSTEDDDGGFKDATVKTVRKVVPAEDTSFIRYPSPDTGSSDLNSSYSSDLSSGELGYRSSPSSEVYYYSQRAQLVQQQQKQQQQQQQQPIGMSIPPVLGSSSSLSIVPNTSIPVTAIPRSHPTTPVSPSDAQMLLPTDAGDLTDLTRNRRYMSRDEMYAAMRHPQYYNMNRNSLPGMPTDYSQNSTPTSSRSSSPAVFGINPPPPYAIRPQVRENFQSLSSTEKYFTNSAATNTVDSQTQVDYNMSNYNNGSSNNTNNENVSGSEIEPPAAYRECISISPTDSQESDTSTTSNQNSRVIAKQTTLMDFKKMILEKSMSSAGGRERISAVEMLRASRPSIYGYSPPPAPVIIKSSQEPPLTGKGEGIIMPPNSRNTARALLFQSRFGSGRRFRSPKTEIISTTILEDRLEDEEEKLYEEDSEDSDEEDISSSTTSSQERRSVQSVRGPLARAYSEPANQKSSNLTPSNLNGKEKGVQFADQTKITPQKVDQPLPKVTHSTPIKPHYVPPQAPDLSVILPQTEEEEKKSSQRKETKSSPEKESIETSL